MRETTNASKGVIDGFYLDTCIIIEDGGPAYTQNGKNERGRVEAQQATRLNIYKMAKLLKTTR